MTWTPPGNETLEWIPLLAMDPARMDTGLSYGFCNPRRVLPTPVLEVAHETLGDETLPWRWRMDEPPVPARGLWWRTWG